MSASTMTMERCFHFKASFLPCTILQLTRLDFEELEQQLRATISQAPNFFTGSPVVIDLEKIKTVGAFHFAALKHMLITNGLTPIGVRGGSLEQHAAAQQEGLRVLTMSRLSSAAEAVKPKADAQPSPTHPAKMVTTPIRSGMQVYAKDTDLIVTAAVSPGAELFADGNIHVYSTLRGRALAGAQGNKEARIFCRSLDAELVSIAGYYLTKEDIQALALPSGTVQIYLESEQVRIGVI